MQRYYTNGRSLAAFLHAFSMFADGTAYALSFLGAGFQHFCASTLVDSLNQVFLLRLLSWVTAPPQGTSVARFSLGFLRTAALQPYLREGSIALRWLLAREDPDPTSAGLRCACVVMHVDEHDKCASREAMEECIRTSDVCNYFAPFLTSGETQGIVPDFALEQALVLAARVASNEDCAETSGSFAKTYTRLVNLVYTHVAVENYTEGPEKWVFEALLRLPSIAPSAEYAGIVGGCFITGLHERALYNVELYGDRFVAVLIDKNSFCNARDWSHMFVDMGMHLIGLEDGDHDFVCYKALFQQQIQDFDTRTTIAAFQCRSQGFYNIDTWDYKKDIAQPLVLPPLAPPSSFNFDTEIFSDDSSDLNM